MHSSALTPLALSSLLSAASAASPARPVAGSTFGLYAYGKGIGGFPVFYMNGSAYIGNVTRADQTLSTAVSFVDNNSTWVANPNTTSSDTSFSNATFFVPDATSSSHQVGFLTGNSTVPDARTTGFMFYGHVGLLTSASGRMEMLFSGLPTDNEGIWSLQWNQTEDANAVPVALKDTPPSRTPHTPQA